MDVNKRPWSPPQLIFSAVIAVFIWSAVGFSWFGFGFDWNTSVGASRISETAVLENLTGVCVAQARGGPDSQAQLKQLAELDSWKRREFVKEARWATMPGSKSAYDGVAELCVDELLKS